MSGEGRDGAEREPTGEEEGRGGDDGPRGSLTSGPACPVPLREEERVQLGHGSGGKMSAALVRERFLPLFDDPTLGRLTDAAVVPLSGAELALSTDTFVVDPLEFPGGDIGSLAIHGTVNDVAMMGARPRYLSVGFVLEEGLSFELLDRIVASMASAARAAGVAIVAGDTKVVERGKADGLYVNTTGVGEMDPDFRPDPRRCAEGDAILVSGPLGRHGIAVMAAREDLGLASDVRSDSAALHVLVDRLREEVGADVHVLRDATRGGLASALNEIARDAGVGMRLEDHAIPVPPAVRAACEVLGLDPLYVANEGVLVATVAAEAEERALQALRSHPTGSGAASVGRVVPDHPGMVAVRTGLGGTRVVDMLPGDQLPRIC
ncbi:MAG: hydrogenase expression/formation protein HypE [Longimicrobiales bacterium]|nr:hydrogenase expression/formation protein HypE [Longimicrobiales bacterium]